METKWDELFTETFRDTERVIFENFERTMLEFLIEKTPEAPLIPQDLRTKIFMPRSSDFSGLVETFP